MNDFVYRHDGQLGGLSEEGARELVALVHRYGVVVATGQSLHDLPGLARLIGDPEVVMPVEHRLPGSLFIRLQSNIDGLGVNGGGHYWHSDGSWRESATDLTLLGCLVAPKRSGRTRFADGALIYDNCSQDIRRELEAATGVYCNRNTMREQLLEMGMSVPEMINDAPDTKYPLARLHPYTKRKALLLNEQWLTYAIPSSESADAVNLAALYRLYDESPFRYLHEWLPGDLLIWDNHRVVHRADALDDGDKKITLRVTIPTINRSMLDAS